MAQDVRCDKQIATKKMNRKSTAKSRKRQSNKVTLELAPSKDDFRDVTAPVHREETKYKSSVLEFRKRLKEAKKAGREEEIVQLMKARRLQRLMENDDDVKGETRLNSSTVERYANLQSSKKKSLKYSTEVDRLARRAANEKSVMVSAVKQAARSEFILPEEAGFLEADEGESTADISQHDIAKLVDIQTAQKHFSLALRDYGPYAIDYSKNGRHLALSSSLGHAAVIDWQPKTLKCEFNVRETAQDVKFLHNETMLAVAQRQWVYIYDYQGIELHCLKMLDSPLQLQFLPFHFLLACSNSKGYLSWLDVSVGEKVAGFQTHRGRLNIMAQNPTSGITYLGHSRGSVTLWSPNSKDSLAEILCQDAAVRSICLDKTGTYMATSGMERCIKIWDMRTYKCLHKFKVPAGATSMNFSSRGLLAAAMGNTVSVYQDTLIKPPSQMYMSHTCSGSVRQVLFCPYEDVLGVGSDVGFESLLIPGAGEPNFDTMEADPYQTKKSRHNQEVKQLLDKIPAHLITLNTESIKELRSDEAIMEEKNKIPKKWLKYHYIPSKSIMETKRRRELKVKLDKEKKERHKRIQEEKRNPKPYDPMDRFKFKG